MASLAGGVGLGLVLPTEAEAETVVAACQSAGLDISTVLVTGALGLDATDGLLYLGCDGDCDVVAVMAAGLTRPRRFVATARQAARHRPVVSMFGPAGSGAGPIKRAWKRFLNSEIFCFERGSCWRLVAAVPGRRRSEGSWSSCRGAIWPGRARCWTSRGHTPERAALPDSWASVSPKKCWPPMASRVIHL